MIVNACFCCYIRSPYAPHGRLRILSLVAEERRINGVTNATRISYIFPRHCTTAGSTQQITGPSPNSVLYFCSGLSGGSRLRACPRQLSRPNCAIDSKPNPVSRAAAEHNDRLNVFLNFFPVRCSVWCGYRPPSQQGYFRVLLTGSLSSSIG